MGSRSPLLVHPTLEEVKLQAAKIGLPESEAEKFFYYYESNGWRVGKNPMKCWLSAMSGWRVRWQGQQSEKNQRANGADRIIWEREYERILAKLKSFNNYSEHHRWTDTEKELVRNLKARRDELRRKLGILL